MIIEVRKSERGRVRERVKQEMEQIMTFGNNEIKNVFVISLGGRNLWQLHCYHPQIVEWRWDILPCWWPYLDFWLLRYRPDMKVWNNHSQLVAIVLNIVQDFLSNILRFFFPIFLFFSTLDLHRGFDHQLYKFLIFGFRFSIFQFLKHLKIFVSNFIEYTC